MTNTPPPTDPAEYREWVKQLDRDWQEGLIPDPRAVAVILMNLRGEVLLQLRDDNPMISFANSWTLPGGVVESHETPAQAAKRELAEETGLTEQLTYWKSYKRKPDDCQFSIEQHIYTGATQRETDEMTLGEGQALRYFGPDRLRSLSIAFDFDKLLSEFFGTTHTNR